MTLFSVEFKYKLYRVCVSAGIGLGRSASDVLDELNIYIIFTLVYIKVRLT